MFRAMTSCLGRPTLIGGSLWSLGVHASAIVVVLVLDSSGVDIEKVVFSGNTHAAPMTVDLHLATQLLVPSSPADVPVAQQAEWVPERLEPDVEITGRLTRDAEGPVVDIGVPVPSAENSTRAQPVVAPTAKEPDSLDSASADRVAARPESAPPQGKPSPRQQRTPPENPLLREDLEQKPALAQPHRVGTEDRTPPDLVGNRPPPYPAAAYRAGIEGNLLLRITISSVGEVERVEVVRSSGYPVLDAAAVRTIRTWRATPARAGGRAVATVELLPVQFRLRRASSR